MAEYRFSLVVNHPSGVRYMVWRVDPEPRRAGWFHAEHDPGSWMCLNEAIAVLIRLIQVNTSPIRIELR